MTTYLTPGVYFEAIDEQAEPVAALRTDVAGFVGVAPKGPVGQSIRLTSWRRFESIFGGLYTDAFLGYAVQAFFENGGRVCHVVRATAPPMVLSLADGAQPSDGASSLIQPIAAVSGAVVTVGQSDNALDEVRTVVSIDPLRQRLSWDSPLPNTFWLDRTLIVEGPRGVATLSTEAASQPSDGASSLVRSVAGFALGDRVHIRQTERTRIRNVRIASIEGGGTRLIWDEPLTPAFDVARPLVLETGAFAAAATFYNQLGEPALQVLANSPGSWGNRLLLRLAVSGAGASSTAALPQPFDRASSIVADVSGYQAGDLVRVYQADASPPTAYLIVAAVDAAGRALIWRNGTSFLPSALGLAGDDRMPSGFDLTRQIALERVDFSLGVYAGGQLRELFTRLSLVPSHPRYAPLVVSTSALVAAQIPDGPSAATAAQLLLYSTERWLEGGRDGLAALTPDDLVTGRQSDGPGGLAALEQVDEVSIVATPDAHLRPGPEQELLPPVPPCCDPCLPCCTPLPTAASPPPSPIERPPSFDEDATFRIQAAMIEQCERLRYRFAILEAPARSGDALLAGATGARQWRQRYDSEFGALYFPWILMRDPMLRGPLRTVPPCGHVAGLYARTDLANGVHRPPANAELQLVQTVLLPVDDVLQGVLNPEGINAIRVFPGRGVRVYGARTVSSDPLWRYVNVRRLLNMIEKSVEYAMQFAVFEGHTYELRQLIRLGISSLLEAVWESGALVGASADQAYYVKCDDANNPPDSVAAGRVMVEVGVAPSVPAEFVVFRVGQTQGEVQVTEMGDRLAPSEAGGR